MGKSGSHESGVISVVKERELIALAGNLITATASSFSSADEEPNKTIDSSGLDEAGQHDVLKQKMWLSSGDPNAWIQYDFGKVIKLASIRVKVN